MIRKLFIVPYFGDLPEWFDLWHDSISRLRAHGYQLRLDVSLLEFQRRVQLRLGIVCPITWNSAKIHDYRAAFGVLYADELQGYEYWGHTDLDCVYGRPDHFVTDEFLDGCDLHTDGNDYVNGPWSLYRATPENAELFRAHPDWRAILEQPETTGWVETSYTSVVREILGERMAVTQWQHRNLTDFSGASWGADGALLEDGEERLFAHFRRTKRWPETLR